MHCRYSYVDMDEDKKKYRPSMPKAVSIVLSGHYASDNILCMLAVFKKLWLYCHLVNTMLNILLHNNVYVA